MNKRFLILIAFIFIATISCKKCYICEARKQGMDEMIDFQKSCGSSTERQKMEDSFKTTYKSTDGYMVTCR